MHAPPEGFDAGNGLARIAAVEESHIGARLRESEGGTLAEAARAIR